MKQNFFYRSLYWRISVIFMVILLFTGLAYVMITSFASDHYYKETTQRLNAHIAEQLLQEVSPFVDGKVNDAALDKIMHSMMAINPSVEVYLLDPEGNILSFVVLYKKVKLQKVSTKPIQEFLDSKGKKFVLGDDPRKPESQNVFSAAPVIIDGKLQGYVYIVLLSEEYENITSELLGSYWMKVGARTLLITLVAAIVAGLISIWFLTRNISQIAEVFNKFQHGNLNARIPEHNMKGELKLLSSTFNTMADTILRNIEDLKQLDRLRRELIANVSHDLRSPLAVIHGYIETLIIKENKLTTADRSHYLEVIQKSSRRLNDLVSDLFELSKLEARQVDLNPEAFFINELLYDTIQHFRILAEEKNLHITTDINTKLPMVTADLNLIERVLQNLLSNAIKYTPVGGNIWVIARQTAQAVLVSISNSGDGIKADALPHIFDRYYKAESSSSGTGLGLAIVKNILDMHGIEIEVSSDFGRITTFSFQMPLK